MKNKEKIIETLLLNPERHFHIRELARESGVHPNVVTRIAEELVQEKIVAKRKYKHLVEYYANYDALEYKRKKRLFNIDQIHQSGIIEYLIDFYNNPKAIVLFGSYSRGEDWSTSDIDVAVVSNKKEKPEIKKYERKLRRKIHLLSFEYQDISDDFYNTLINGIVLHGYIKDERLSHISKGKKS